MRDYPVSSLVIDSVTNGSSDSGFIPELNVINALYYQQSQQSQQSQQPAGDPCAHTEK